MMPSVLLISGWAATSSVWSPIRSTLKKTGIAANCLECGDWLNLREISTSMPMVCVGWSLHVCNLTPTLVHDTLHGVGQLNDAQRNALYPALLKAYRPIVFGCAAALAAWILFAVFVLRGPRHSDS